MMLDEIKLRCAFFRQKYIPSSISHTCYICEEQFGCFRNPAKYIRPKWDPSKRGSTLWGFEKVHYTLTNNKTKTTFSLQGCAQRIKWVSCMNEVAQRFSKLQDKVDIFIKDWNVAWSNYRCYEAAQLWSSLKNVFIIDYCLQF